MGGIATLRLHCHKLAPQFTRGITEHMTALGYARGAEMARLVPLGRSTQYAWTIARGRQEKHEKRVFDKTSVCSRGSLTMFWPNRHRAPFI